MKSGPTVRIASWFTINGVTKKNSISVEYIGLLQALLTYGQKLANKYTYGQAYSLPTSVKFKLLNNGVVVATIPAVLSSFTDTPASQCNATTYNLCSPSTITATLTLNGIDESSSSYTFNEVQLWAGDVIVAYTTVPTSQKTGSVPIKVTWQAVLEVEPSNVLYTPTCTSNNTTNLNANVTNFLNYACIDLPYLIIVTSILPVQMIPQNSLAYQQLSLLQNLVGSIAWNGLSYYVVQGDITGTYPINQPLILLNSQSNSQVNITVVLLYNVSGYNAVYTLPQKFTLNTNKVYIPVLNINVATT